MKIILAEERRGVQLTEQSFDKNVIVLGRDASECDIAFDNDLFPMVSRRHAELRWQNGRWVIIDLNSTYGVLVDGQRITAPQPVAAGSALQFGADGAVVRVVWHEIADSDPYLAREPAPAAVPTPAIVPPPPPAAPSPPAPVTPSAHRLRISSESVSIPPLTPPLKPNSQAAQVEFLNAGSRPPIRLTAATNWIGREPDCAILIDGSAAMVSRRHAFIRTDNGSFVLEDNHSFNGTLVNEQRISNPTPLYHNDEIRLGLGGPVLRFNSPSLVAPLGAGLAAQRALDPAISGAEPVHSKTMVMSADTAARFRQGSRDEQKKLLMSVAFDSRGELSIGRDESNDIKLDGLQISNRHARLSSSGGQTTIEDLNSTNGVYVNGMRVSRQALRPGDSVQIGSFEIRLDASGGIGVFDARSNTRIDAVNLTKTVRNRMGRGRIKLLDGISLSIQPNEFIGLLGPSGSGKSTLIEALNGMRPADSGNVLINDLDLYRHLDSLKQAIGYVPQDDIIHRELTVFRTLYYIAKLRLSRDVSAAEVRQIVSEVLDVTGLSERRNVPINQLSGGQRKRVSIAVELITKPSVIFLDEPTSGLDPAAEERVMKLFRQISDSGRTVILTTHAMENVKLFDKIVVLIGGKLAFYGKPEAALRHLQATSFKELYARLEAPVEQAVKEQGEKNRRQITEQVAEEWKQKFLVTPDYKTNIHEPLSQLGSLRQAKARKKNRLGIFGSIRQWITLSRRYFEVLLKDKLTLFILFAQAPAIALLTFFVMEANQPRDFVYFVVALVAVWFGTSVSAREIIRERPVYKRERMVNLGILPYLGSKLLVLGIIVGIQCLMLWVPLKFFDLTGLMPMPGETGGIPQLWTMLTTAGVGVALGLLVSALVRTSEMATSLVPLILIPQILFSGLVGVPHGVSKVAGLVMPAAWSFDTMKRFSTLDTLEEEGADPNGKTKGLGLYRYLEKENEKIVNDARKDLEDLKSAGVQFQGDGQSGPAIGEIKKLPDDLSPYVTFLHPWMNEVLNQVVLMLMFGMLVIATIIVLRIKDLV